MLLVHSNMDGYQILKILLVAFIRAYHMRQWKNLLFQWNYGNKYPFSPKTAWKNGITFFQTQILPPLRRLPPGFYSSKESWNPKFSRGMVKSGGIWRNGCFLELWSGVEWFFCKKLWKMELNPLLSGVQTDFFWHKMIGPDQSYQQNFQNLKSIHIWMN